MTTLVARVTYELRPMRCEIALRPEPLRAGDVWTRTADGTKVLREPSDLSPLKLAGDILLVGSAFAPAGASVTEVTTRLLVGEVDKALRVTGPRTFAVDGAAGPPAVFQEAPLDWTRTAGGEGTWNPVGVKMDAVSLGPTPAPSVLPAELELRTRSDFVSPSGYAPIPMEWPPRRGRGDDALADWLEPGRVAEPYWPEGADGRVFQAALADQQLARPIRPDERIHLENLHRAHPRLVTSLPGNELHAAVVDERGHRNLAMVADTLWIDTDRALATVTWRVALPSSELAGRDVFLWLDGFDDQVAADMADAAGETMQPDPPRAPELPFHRDAAAAQARRAAEDDYERLATGTIAAEMPSGSPQRTSTPFAAAASSPFPSAVAPPPPPPSASSLPSAALREVGPAAAMLAAPPLMPPAFVKASVAGLPSTSIAPSGPRPLEVQPSWGPAMPPKPDATTPAIDTWKLHEAAQARRSTDEPALVIDTSRAEPISTPSAQPSARVVTGAPIEVVWVEAAVEVTQAMASKSLRGQLARDASDDEWVAAAEAAGGAAERTRRDVARVFRDAKVLDLDRVGSILSTTLQDDPAERAFVVLSGELVWTFDPSESLRAWIAVGTPMAADPRIKEAIEHAERTRLESIAAVPDVLLAAVERLRDAVKTVTKMVGASTIESSVERYVIEERGFGRRRLWGERRLRAHLHGRVRAPIPLYFPESAGWDAPLAQRFPARILGELRNRQDPTEASPVCVRALAFGVELTS